MHLEFLFPHYITINTSKLTRMEQHNKITRALQGVLWILLGDSQERLRKVIWCLLLQTNWPGKQIKLYFLFFPYFEEIEGLMNTLTFIMFVSYRQKYLPEESFLTWTWLTLFCIYTKAWVKYDTGLSFLQITYKTLNRKCCIFISIISINTA